MDKYKVPAKLDGPVPFFAWEIIDMVVAMLILGATILMGNLLFGVIGSVMVLKSAKKLRQGQKEGQVPHMLWRTGMNLDSPLRKYGVNPLILEFYK